MCLCRWTSLESTPRKPRLRREDRWSSTHAPFSSPCFFSLFLLPVSSPCFFSFFPPFFPFFLSLLSFPSFFPFFLSLLSFPSSFPFFLSLLLLFSIPLFFLSSPFAFRICKHIYIHAHNIHNTHNRYNTPTPHLISRTSCSLGGSVSCFSCLGIDKSCLIHFSVQFVQPRKTTNKMI